MRTILQDTHYKEISWLFEDLEFLTVEHSPYSIYWPSQNPTTCRIQSADELWYFIKWEGAGNRTRLTVERDELGQPDDDEMTSKITQAIIDELKKHEA